MLESYNNGPTYTSEVMHWFAAQGMDNSINFERECREHKPNKFKYLLAAEVLGNFNIFSDRGGISPKAGGFAGLISAANHC